MFKLFRKCLALLLALGLSASLYACSNGGMENKGSSSDLLPAFDKTLGIDEVELTKTKGVIITATELTYNNYEAVLGIIIENTSKTEKNVSAGSRAYCVNSVNGFMIHEGFINVDIAPGETKEEEISFSYDEMYACGISKIADIEVGFKIREDYKDTFTGPISIKTSAAEKYDYKTDTYLKAFKGNTLKKAYGITVNSLKEKKLYSEDGISLISEAVMTNKDGHSRLMLEFESKAERVMNIRISNLSINGIVVEDSYVKSDMICSGKRDIVSISLKNYAEDNEELKGKSIKNVSFDIRLQNDSFKDLTEDQSVSIKL